MRTPLAVVVLTLLASTALARPVGVWSYESLVAAADLVAVVEVSSIEKSGEKLEGHGDSDRFQAYRAVLTAAWIIKGGSDHKKIELLYFGYSASPPPEVVNGALFISFANTERKQYLVFLKRNHYGVYIPVTGDYDASISVKVIERDQFSPPRTN